jgi:hypothetical protein
MAVLRQALNELVRAAIILALFVFLLGTPAALAAAPPSLVQQASALLSGQSLCGHGPAPTACHAPGACCRPDHALPPPCMAEALPPRGDFTRIVHGFVAAAPPTTGTIAAAWSRAPPA